MKRARYAYKQLNLAMYSPHFTCLKTGLTAVYYASLNNHHDLAKFLMESGADITDKSNKRRSSLIHAAAEGGDSSTLQQLIAKGFNVNEQNKVFIRAPSILTRLVSVFIMYCIIAPFSRFTNFHYCDRNSRPLFT